MKFHIYDLEEHNNSAITIDEVIQFDESDVASNSRFTDISEVEVFGTGFYDQESKEFVVGLEISCQVVVPCAITLKPIEIDLDAQLSEVFGFKEPVMDDAEDNSDVLWVEGLEVDLLPFIWSAVIAEIPIKVVDPELTEYPSGDGWEVLTEAALEKQKEVAIDPRLEKLKEFKFDE